MGEEPAGAAAVVVNIVTADTIILGTLALPTVGAAGGPGHHVRFLDVLNNPRLGSVQMDRVRDSVVLTDCSVLPRQGPRIEVARELFVRPEAIVCAYEHEGERRPEDVAFNPALPQRPERVAVLTVNGLHLQGTLLGGANTLAAPRQKRFVGLADASLAQADRLRTRLAVPFLALNYDAVVAFTPGAASAR